MIKFVFNAYSFSKNELLMFLSIYLKKKKEILYKLKMYQNEKKLQDL